MSAKCEHCGHAIHRVPGFGWLHDYTGRRRCDLPVYVDASPVQAPSGVEATG